ncbi:Hypothetical predicted protein [Olea europaea subsp. europaea]|uniref:DUF1985 domain-containing protein n=1 Tax=Olea europaea subsp. europaea TaxID=158383 RepID=A0A8S0Q7Q7_OLEEU|nr:Hypothetical predicted protein [Olea europaea subsp. europaea]
MDHFNDRQREDFRNSPFGYLAEVPKIQFSAQLIQQQVFKTIHTDKVNELWFNVQGNLMRFGLQEYTLVTGLRCSVFPEGDDFDQVLERIGYRRLLHGFRGFWTKKIQKAKKRQEKEITYAIHSFPIAMQVWAYEASPEIGERFGQRVGERIPRLLSCTRADDGDTTSGTSGSSLTRGEVEDLLLDQRILLQMRLRTVKLEIERHVTSKCKKLRDFLATLVAPAGSTPVAATMPADTEAGVSSSLPQDVNGGDMEPCPDEQDMRADTRTAHLQGGGQIEPLFAIPDLNGNMAIIFFIFFRPLRFNYLPTANVERYAVTYVL